MRVNNLQLEVIKFTFLTNFLEEDRIWLFGSRADPNQKGGDIDLYIETHYQDLDLIVKKEINFLAELNKKIGEQKIDVVINILHKNKNLPIYDEAKSSGVRLI